MRILHVSIVVLAVASGGSVSGCGGKVVLDTSGGAGGTAGAGGAGGAGGVILESTTATVSTTVGVSSNVSTSSGGSSQCPTLAPNTGDPCSAPGLVCPVPVCCGGTATCTGSTWQVEGGACSQPCLSCPGTIGCEAGAVCVDNPLGGGVSTGQPHYNCALDPCGGAPLSCACAQPLCESGPCAQASGFSVTCTSLAG
jgi:hypothetical protein